MFEVLGDGTEIESSAPQIKLFYLNTHKSLILITTYYYKLVDTFAVKSYTSG